MLHARSVLIFNEKKAALEKGDDALKYQIGEGRDIMSILCTLRRQLVGRGDTRFTADALVSQYGRTCWQPKKIDFLMTSSSHKSRACCVWFGDLRPVLTLSVSTMTLAGMDTTSNSLARVLQLLAEHSHVQDKLREEIVSAEENEGRNGTLGYDQLMALPYLDAVCRETLRM